MGASTSTCDDSLAEACKQGDIERVRQLLPHMTYETINQQGPDGNTPLHWACAGHHREIVILLLNERHLCSRTILNKQRLTAYQLTASDDIRKIFRRPSISKDRRFFDGTPISSLQPTPISPNTQIKSSKSIPNDWVRGYTDMSSATESTLMMTLSNSPFLIKKFLQLRTANEAQYCFGNLLQQCAPKMSTTHQALLDEYERYKSTKDIKCLLHIYTCESVAHTALQTDTSAFSTLLFLHLNDLRDRAFTGQTYRGATMTSKDIEAYRWAKNSHDYILEARIPQSTSQKEAVAEMYIPEKSTSNKIGVILTYQFFETCLTAIDIAQISQFPEEEEVLVLPFTLFRVNDITVEPTTGIYKISLNHVPTRKKSLLTAWWNLKN